MLIVKELTIFRRDLKRTHKRNKPIEKLKEIVRVLAGNKLLPERCKDHALTGNYIGHRECHIEPDWLLIYRIEEDNLVLVRTGSHTDLFD